MVEYIAAKNLTRIRILKAVRKVGVHPGNIRREYSRRRVGAGRVTGFLGCAGVWRLK